MCLFGMTLFSDKSEIPMHWKYLPLLREFSQIHKFSWGSPCLAQTYRSLCWASRYDCKDMNGALPLLLVWAWIRMPLCGTHTVPTGLRRMLFHLRSTMVQISKHPTDRIRRQFGFHQDPPVGPMKLGASHNIVLTGPKNKNKGMEHEEWISQWLNSPASILTGAYVDHYQPSDQYMD
ncbi:hypothetical protein Ahy_A01g002897 [Arachis hypogaea]|uniref:Aminotransferase-like plant mobile domain-containing protein n=1 Tax=Arachis hypogaea TaxID=3818 RepID=A0A445ES71_ARAHY|nr:hypothetical protein Ahy_A01g002897 [Arachis hypogaea]